MANWSNGTAGSSKRAMTATAGVIGSYMRSKSAAPDQAIVSGLCAVGDDQYMDYTSSAEGTATSMADGIALEQNANVANFVPISMRSARCLRSRSFAHSSGMENISAMSFGSSAEALALPDSVAVVDRPEDLQLRVGTSKVFAEATRAKW
jgi:hypothetical protein